ncbi:MAG TPA: alpha/beta fold hydrolase [Mycobacterium sp.]|nr:alpha/beta fold hydrolase [Mycobacterium sp.]
MSTVQPRVVNAGGVPMSALLAEAENQNEQPRAVLVALHGGGTTSAYFDCPGRPRLSLLRTGAALGYTVVALDRPGYGSSAPYPDAMTDPGQRVNLAYLAVDRVLGERPRGAGLFVMAHSNGCELALRMAADDRGTDLLGLELAGTGLHYHPAARDVLATARPDHRPAGLRELLWEPTRLYPADVLGGITNASTGAAYEAAMVTDWPRHDFPALAGQARVPVQFSFAEHEKVWQSDSAAQAEIGAMFTAAPSFAVNEQASAGHNLSLGWTATAYHLSVFSFVEQCVVASTATDVDLEAG